MKFEEAGPSSPSPDFATTQWSIVVQAGGGNGGDARVALEQLCQRYWYPLYAYIRSRVGNSTDAQDITQEFFARFLEKELIVQARPERGRFRNFLLTSAKNFVSNEWNKAHAVKRGGKSPVLSLDFASADSQYKLEPAHDLTPERLYERKWALALLEHVLVRLGSEYTADGKSETFELLRHFIGPAASDVTYAKVAAALEMTEGAAKVAAHRLRRRYRELIREELAQTLADPSDIEDEIAWLFKALA